MERKPIDAGVTPSSQRDCRSRLNGVFWMMMRVVRCVVLEYWTNGSLFDGFESSRHESIWTITRTRKLRRHCIPTAGSFRSRVWGYSGSRMFGHENDTCKRELPTFWLWILESGYFEIAQYISACSVIFRTHLSELSDASHFSSGERNLSVSVSLSGDLKILATKWSKLYT